jgi:vacuolar-type H+-ATPase subunit I/STV1
MGLIINMGDKENEINNNGCNFGQDTAIKVDKMISSIYELDRRVNDIDKKASLSQEATRTLEKANDRLETLYNKTITAIEKSADVFLEVQTTMIRMQEEIKHLGNCTDDMKEDTRYLKVEVEEIKKNFNASEELRKIDLADFFKRNLWAILVGIFGLITGGCGIIFAFITNINNIANFAVNFFQPYIK